MGTLMGDAASLAEGWHFQEPALIFQLSWPLKNTCASLLSEPPEIQSRSLGGALGADVFLQLLAGARAEPPLFWTREDPEWRMGGHI